MPKRPYPIKRLDALFSAAMIAHEAIFEMRSEKIARDQGDAQQEGLLEEFGADRTRELPALTSSARRLAGEWQITSRPF